MVLENVTFKKTNLGKSEKTSGNRYLITLKNKRNNEKISFQFHDNYKNECGLIDFVKCLELDAKAYEYSYNLADFMNEFGYEDKTKASKIYNACKKQYIRFNKLFNEEDQKEIEEIEY